MSSEARTIRQYAELIRAGHKVDIATEQFATKTRSDLQLLIEVTQKAGGPMAKTLDRFATVLGLCEQSRRELELAVAGPKASARLVLSLPVLVFLGAGIAGIPIFRTLATPSLVWVSFGVGLALFWLGSLWTNRILRKAEPSTEDPGLRLDAMGIGLNAGLPSTVAAGLAGNSDTGELQDLGQGAGIALSQLVADRADSLRQEQFNSDRMRIQKAAVAVLWPLGLTVLPAFVLLAIIPIGTALIQSQ